MNKHSRMKRIGTSLATTAVTIGLICGGATAASAASLPSTPAVSQQESAASQSAPTSALPQLDWPDGNYSITNNTPYPIQVTSLHTYQMTLDNVYEGLTIQPGGTFVVDYHACLSDWGAIQHIDGDDGADMQMTAIKPDGSTSSFNIHFQGAIISATNPYGVILVSDPAANVNIAVAQDVQNEALSNTDTTIVNV